MRGPAMRGAAMPRPGTRRPVIGRPVPATAQRRLLRKVHREGHIGHRNPPSDVAPCAQRAGRDAYPQGPVPADGHSRPQLVPQVQVVMDRRRAAVHPVPHTLPHAAVEAEIGAEKRRMPHQQPHGPPVPAYVEVFRNPSDQRHRPVEIARSGDRGVLAGIQQGCLQPGQPIRRRHRVGVEPGQPFALCFVEPPEGCRGHAHVRFYDPPDACGPAHLRGLIRAGVVHHQDLIRLPRLA